MLGGICAYTQIHTDIHIDVYRKDSKMATKGKSYRNKEIDTWESTGEIANPLYLQSLN